jgi:hypothetical protein
MSEFIASGRCSTRLAFLDEEIAEQKASIRELRIYEKGAGDDKGNAYLDKLLLSERQHLSYLRKRRKKIAKPDAQRTALILAINESLDLSLRNHLTAAQPCVAQPLLMRQHNRSSC